MTAVTSLCLLFLKVNRSFRFIFPLFVPQFECFSSSVDTELQFEGLSFLFSVTVVLFEHFTQTNRLWVSSSGRPAGPPAWGDRLASAGPTLNKAWWWRLKSNRILKRENIKLLIQRFRSLIYHQIYKIQEFTHKNMFIISTHQIESSPWQQRPSDCTIRVCMCVFPLLPRDYYCNQ